MSDIRERLGVVRNRLCEGLVWVDRMTSAVPGVLGRRFLRFGAAVVGAEERLRGERGTVAEAAATGALMSVVSALVLVWYVDVLVGYTLDAGVYGLVVTAFGSFWVTTAAVYGARDGDGARNTGGNEGAVPPGRAEVPGYVRPWRGVEVHVPDYVGRDRVVPDEAALNAARRLTVLGVGAVLFTLGVAVQVLTALGPPLAGSIGIDGSLLSASTLDRGFLLVVGTMVLTVEFRHVLGDWKDWTFLGYVVVLSVLVGVAYGFLGPEAAGVLALTGLVVVQTAALAILAYHLLLAVRVAVGPLERRLPYEREP
ncbi:MAG: hypothetical protein V5A62_16655 [Haloarculaceae archaeon]